MYRFIGKWHDLIAAVVSTIVVLIVGTYLAYYYQPVWLNRAGSLIIIIGVILAVNRIHEIFENRFINLFDRDGDKVLNDVVEKCEKKFDKPLTTEEHAELKELARPELVSLLRSTTAERKHIFRYFEVWLIIVGTFLNGFGDYLVCFLKSCST